MNDAQGGERTFIVSGPLRDMGAFRKYADIACRLKRYGRVLIEVSPIADKSWYELPAGGSPWHEYAAYNAALFKFFPHPKISSHLPAQWVEKNRQLLLAKAEIAKGFGLGGFWNGYIGNFLPEASFRQHPHLRGPRVDHPRRSRREEFATCLDLDESLEMLAWMMSELRRAVPDLAAFAFRTNDAGGGLCWAAAQYSGPNGPRHRPARARHRRDAPSCRRGGRQRLPIFILNSNFWQGEPDMIHPLLPANTYYNAKDNCFARLGTRTSEV